MFTLATLATSVACSDHPAGVTAEEVGVTEFVITEGIAAPLPLRAMPGPRFSTLQNATLSVGGSTTSPLTLNGAGCSEVTKVKVRISYRVNGSQDSDASFRVDTLWDYNGTTFVGSEPKTVHVAAASGPPRTYEVDIVVTNTSGQGVGQTQFTIAPYDLVTNLSDPGGLQLSFEASSAATVFVEFIDCDPVPTNTSPTITVPGDITEEATSSSGAAVSFVVSASDMEDGDLTDSVVCKIGDDVVVSGDTIPLGETTVTCSVTDSGGLTATDSFKITVQDTTAPVFTAFPGDQTLIATDINGLALDLSAFTITAEDQGPNGEPGDVSGPVTITCEIDGMPADGFQIAIGQTATVSCTATDSSEHPEPNTSDPQTFDVFVGLDLTGIGGFLPPLRMAEPYSVHKRNSTIPHKFPAPKYADGSLATDLASGLKLVLVNLGTTPQAFDTEVEDVSAGSTAWRWDPDSEHYIFNVKTDKYWSEGTWETVVSYAGIELARTQFGLKK